MEWFKAIGLGVVEGLTEFIPVSSTGHLILAGHWIEFSGRLASSFEIFIQLGAIAAVVVLYFERFGLLATTLLPSKAEERQKQLNLLHVFLGMMPALFFGFLFYHAIKEYLFSPQTVAIGLIAGGVLMLFGDRLVRARGSCKSLDELSYGQVFWVGMAQCFSLWPGVSRSAATILGGLACGMGYSVAAEFSFILAVPVMGAAVSYDLLKSWREFALHDVGIFMVGAVVSFFVALTSIKIFLNLLIRYKLAPFGWYRIVLGIVVLIILR